MALRAPFKSLAAPLLLLGCGPGAAPFTGTVPFPTARELPAGFEDGCACVTRRQCPIAEQILGSSDYRNISCRWIQRNSLADCRFEARFTEIRTEPDGNLVTEEPGPWRAGAVRARLLASGRWCAEERQ
jgi:hypothetical protein